MTNAAHLSLLAELSRLDVGHCIFAAPLRDYCTWRIGGPADLLVEPQNIAQIQRLRRFAYQHDLPCVVIGQGSNLLFSDAGVRGIILRVGQHLARLQIEGDRINAEAGVWVPALARKAQQAGLTGMEHIVGIPGTVGGLVLMNGGSHRQSIGDLVEGVTLVTLEGEIQELSAAACDFSYRHSALQGSGGVVVKVDLLCPHGDRRTIRQTMLADLRERRGKFPLRTPNCGSVFLSSAAMHASVGPPGRIIEERGLKGRRVGGAEVSLQHANFIVNRGGATADDVLTLITAIRAEVRNAIGFELDCEVRYVSPTGEIMPAHRACPRP
ncbi:MAG: UDP-N-acetylmuramate dehydrogenase [Desulfuromonadales bacterium]|nr:UDP-N-acetylmuramate dehydrogenase [Desulfuromonadales bacterium]